KTKNNSDSISCNQTIEKLSVFIYDLQEGNSRLKKSRNYQKSNFQTKKWKNFYFYFGRRYFLTKFFPVKFKFWKVRFLNQKNGKILFLKMGFTKISK
ncbi:MAG: hypothetical protein ABWZ79_04960, partial [Pedobacter agri]